MIFFFRTPKNSIIAVEKMNDITEEELSKLTWLFSGSEYLKVKKLEGTFIGPRKEMITPWSSNATDITHNMGIGDTVRIEEYQYAAKENPDFDPMLQTRYEILDQSIFRIDREPDPVIEVNNISEYNEDEGLALSSDEVEYLNEVSQQIGRLLTDSEVYGFAQINSEHCRHKIFNGSFIINGEEKKDSLFTLIKKTSKSNPNRIVSAYKDNVAFILGPRIEQFAPEKQDKAGVFTLKPVNSIISLKAETHNFPTTVEPFNGASTGTGGEIRDRMAGGKGSLPLAGTAVYMTSYPRTEYDRKWEQFTEPRKWLYQTPEEILIKASNGASDFGNKFGQPLINGSLLTFEHKQKDREYGYDKVIMLAGGIGFAKKEDGEKDIPEEGDIIVMLGGDNYRIGMGGGAVSSVATGEYGNTIELNAVQRANPEMQKRVINAIRAMHETDKNPVVSIHDHGAGGHLNCFSELVENTGGTYDINKLPVGDPTLSIKEILGNESQERMGLVIKEKDLNKLEEVCKRERSPIYKVGRITGDQRLEFQKNEVKPVDLPLENLFGKPPKTILTDNKPDWSFEAVTYDQEQLRFYLEQVLQLEAVACKDWLTNKVDRSVTGRVAKQQCAGDIQLPLNNLGACALDYQGIKGVATALGHAPVAGLVSAANGSVLSVAEALTNLIWAPLEEGIKGVSLSANWMWPAKNPGENARLYEAVEAISEFAIKLGINIPTGKDSLSMTQKYPGGQMVLSPGTVIVSAVGEVTDVRKIVEPVLRSDNSSELIYINLTDGNYCLGGSSFSQVVDKLGTKTPEIKNPEYFAKAFNTVQDLIKKEMLVAGHDISAGGMITALLEMCFGKNDVGISADLTETGEEDIIRLLFAENPGLLLQVKNYAEAESVLKAADIKFYKIGKPVTGKKLVIKNKDTEYNFDIHSLRDIWYKSSYLLDRKQCGEVQALERYKNYKNQEISFKFPENFSGQTEQYGIDISRREKTGIKAAIIREQGVNGDREMAFLMHLAGFDVKDIHMTDLISGREDLSDVNFIVFVGGFANSDVLGSAKGWAGAFLYNEKAKTALEHFYRRKDTLSLGVCNGCQLMMELNLVYPSHKKGPSMSNNDSGKFESAFLTVDVEKNNSIMLGSLAGCRLGIYVAHGEGKFVLAEDIGKYNIPIRYSFKEYPGNPNGSPDGIAALCSDDGRHLVMMPHLERAFFPWHWANYPHERKSDEITPWVEAFVNARKWVEMR